MADSIAQIIKESEYVDELHNEIYGRLNANMIVDHRIKKYGPDVEEEKNPEPNIEDVEAKLKLHAAEINYCIEQMLNRFAMKQPVIVWYPSADYETGEIMGIVVNRVVFSLIVEVLDDSSLHIKKEYLTNGSIRYTTMV